MSYYLMLLRACPYGRLLCFSTKYFCANLEIWTTELEQIMTFVDISPFSQGLQFPPAVLYIHHDNKKEKNSGYEKVWD